MRPFFAASGLETLITLLIFVIVSVVSTWLNKQRAKSQPGAPPALPGQKPEHPPAPAANWEEELRRLLEGDEPRPEPPAPPPMLLREEPSRPPPPLPPTPKPAVVRPPVEPNEEDFGLPVPMPAWVESAQAHQRASQLERKVDDFMRQRGSMAEATAAYQQAQRLDERVAAHLKHVAGNITTYTAARKVSGVPPEQSQARAMLRNPQALRSALITSMILGPPKALEN